MKTRDEDDRRFQFTRPRLDALKAPDKGFAEYHDTKPGVRGLVLVVVYTGGKSFFVKRRVNGVPKRIRIGKYPEVPIELARREAERINGDLALGNDPTAKAAAFRDEPTLDELFEKYVASPRKRGGTRKERTIAEYRKILGNYLKSYRKRRISVLTHEELAALHKTVATKNGPYAANRVLSLVKALYNFAIDREKLKVQNPAIGIVAEQEVSRDRRLWNDEVQALFEALEIEANRDVRDFVFLALVTGARKSNILSMRWEDVLPLKRGIWRIPDTKNGLPQNLPLMPEAIEVLESRLARRDGRFVFPGDGATGHLVDVKRRWERILATAGIPDFRIHDLRRTLGSYLVDAGATLEATGKALNHKSTTATKIYARMSVDPVRQAMMAGTAAILEAAGMKRDAAAGASGEKEID